MVTPPPALSDSKLATTEAPASTATDTLPTPVEDRLGPVIAAMQRILDLPAAKLLPEREVAAYIISLHKSKGPQAANDFVERMLGNNPKLLGYERTILVKKSPTLAATKEGIGRRRFNAMLGEASAGFITASTLGGVVFNATFGAGDKVLDESAQYVPGATGLRERAKAGQEQKNALKTKDLVQYVHDNPLPPDTTTVAQEKAFYPEIDRKVTQLKPAVDEKPVYQKALPIIGGIAGVIFSERVRRKANSDMESAYIDTARYIAHRITEVIKQEYPTQEASQTV